MRMFRVKFLMATPSRSSLSGLTMTSTTDAGEWQCELEGRDGKGKGKWLSW